MKYKMIKCQICLSTIPRSIFSHIPHEKCFALGKNGVIFKRHYSDKCRLITSYDLRMIFIYSTYLVCYSHN